MYRSSDAAPDRHLGRRFLLVLPEVPLRRVHLPHFRVALEHRQVPGHHLLLAIVGHAHRVVADGVAAHGRLVARPDEQLLLHLEALAREAEEHQDDAQVDDVAAVAPLRASHEADQGREVVGAGALLPYPGAAHELLHDRGGHERAEREAEARDPGVDAPSPAARCR
jgi:hypothetical protein